MGMPCESTTLTVASISGKLSLFTSPKKLRVRPPCAPVAAGAKANRHTLSRTARTRNCRLIHMVAPPL